MARFPFPWLLACGEMPHASQAHEQHSQPAWPGQGSAWHRANGLHDEVPALRPPPTAVISPCYCTV